MKVLNIVESAYRGTIEEQDDTILWLTLAMRANARMDILLKGNAVNYAVAGQKVEGLTIGDIHLTHPPQITEDIKIMQSKDINFLAVREDIEARNISKDELISGIEVIAKATLPNLFEKYDKVWYW